MENELTEASLHEEFESNESISTVLRVKWPLENRWPGRANLPQNPRQARAEIPQIIRSLAQRPQSLSKKDNRPETQTLLPHRSLSIMFHSLCGGKNYSDMGWQAEVSFCLFVMREINSRVISLPLRAPRFLRVAPLVVRRGRKMKRANVTQACASACLPRTGGAMRPKSSTLSQIAHDICLLS